MVRNVRHIVRRWQDSLDPAAARRLETLQVSAVLLVLLALFFHRAVIGGQKLVPADIAFGDPVFAGEAPEDFTGPHNALLYDQAYQFYPWRVYAWRSLWEGRLPLWNPLIYCGTPFMAADQPAVLYPLNLLSLLVPPVDAVLLTAVLRLLIAGLGMYWFVRVAGGNALGALVGAVTFTFSGFMVVWLGHPHTNVAAWLPALLLTEEWLCQAPKARNVALVALVVALHLTGGHTETALYTLSTGALYLGFRVLQEWRESARRSAGDTASSDPPARAALIRLRAFSLAVVLGLALASVHILPLLAWVGRSAVFQIRTGADRLVSWRPGLKYQAAGLLLSLLPNAFNNPAWPGQYQSFLPIWNFSEQTLYIGVVGLALGATSVLLRRRESRVVFFAVVAVCALGAALSIPPFDLLNHLPVFSFAKPGRLRLIFTCALSVLAGMGASELARDGAEGKSWRMALGILTGITLVMMAALLLLPRILIPALVTPNENAMAALVEPVSAAYNPANLQLYFPLIVALLGLAILAIGSWRGAQLRGMAAKLLVVVIVVDLFAFGAAFHTTVEPGDVFPTSGIVEVLQTEAGLFRVVGTDIHLMPNVGMIHGFSDVRGLEFPEQRFSELLRAIGGKDWLGYGILFGDQLDPRLLGLMNVQYVVTSSDLSSVEPKLLLELEHDGVRLYKNPSCLPRAFVVHETMVCERDEDILSILRDPSFDLRAVLVLESAPPDGVGAEPTSGLPAGGTTRDEARIARYSSGNVLVDVNVSEGGYLFLGDSYDPDWRAYIDGAETRIYRADYAFRAVRVPSGFHVVEFVYKPAAFSWGIAVSLLGLIGVTILLLWPWIVARRCNIPRALQELEL